jgi:hypothetical protein
MEKYRYSCQILMKLELLHKYLKSTNFMTIRPVGAELFHVDRRTDGQTDMTKRIVAFRNFVNATKETGKDNQRTKGIRIGPTKE